MEKRIYGIMGRKGHGKDTFAKAVVERDPNFTILHFADDLKMMCAQVFELSEYQMYDTIGKEEPFAEPEVMDRFLPMMSEVTGLEITAKGKIATSPRQILQYFGTDYVRAAKDSYWVDRVLDKIAAGAGHFLVPDIRFPNEVEAIKGIGGKTIRIYRQGKADDANSVHTSETALDDFIADFTYSFDTLEALHTVAFHFAEEAYKYTECWDPRKSLQRVVDELNQKLDAWGHSFKWGANIVPAYDKEGKKYFKVAHAGPSHTSVPSEATIKAAGKIIEGALNETLAAADASRA